MKEGYEIVDFAQVADVYIINTCTVTENAEKDCRQIVRRALKTNPHAFIAVTGCYAQLRPGEIANITGVDAVLGTNEKFKLFSLIENFEKRDLACIHTSSDESLQSDFFSAFSADGETRTRAFLKIQDGCDYTCSFCTIPAARGKSRSDKHQNVLQNFSELLKRGYKEIILTGVNVGDYTDEDGKDFFALLRDIVAIPGDFRVRISSIEPNLLTDDILQLVKSEKKLCKHFHIPLQSGNSKILKLMQRRYNAEFYSKLINKVKAEIPEAGIGVDVIVGFPGESDEDFQVTAKFLAELPISYLHVFTYSERPGTKAISMENKVETLHKKERNKILRIISEKKKLEFFDSMKDIPLQVLFELENDSGFMKGFSDNYIRMQQAYNSEKINKFTYSKIIGTDTNICHSISVEK